MNEETLTLIHNIGEKLSTLLDKAIIFIDELTKVAYTIRQELESERKSTKS